MVRIGATGEVFSFLAIAIPTEGKHQHNGHIVHKWADTRHANNASAMMSHLTLGSRATRQSDRRLGILGG